MSDESGKPAAERLFKLSDEVNRIASALVRASTHKAVWPDPNPVDADSAEITAEAVRSALRARRLRSRYFSEDLFADPAWDMMLKLLLAELMQQRVTTTSLCEAAAVPATTALRWLNNLVQKGLFIRHDDPIDSRRRFVELAPKTSAALRAYFVEIS